MLHVQVGHGRARGPLGLYRRDVYYYVTFFLGVAAGVDPDQARMIALAAQYIDDNPETKPLNVWDANGHNQRLLAYHFVLSDWGTGKVLAAHDNSSLGGPYSPQLKCLFQASDTAIRASKPDAGRILFGEALHALQDTYGHRDRDNMPFAANGGIGHAFYFSEPDYTYNDRMDETSGTPLPLGWYVREQRTLAMEEAVFALLLNQYGNPATARTWADIKPIVERFNQFRANEETRPEDVDSGYADGSFAAKIDILNAALAGLGIAGVDMNTQDGAYRYKDTDGRVQREANLRGLDPDDYRCTILPGSKFSAATECSKK